MPKSFGYYISYYYVVARAALSADISKPNLERFRSYGGYKQLVILQMDFVVVMHVLWKM